MPLMEVSVWRGIRIVIKNMVCEKSVSYVLALKPYASCLASIGISVLIYNMGIAAV